MRRTLAIIVALAAMAAFSHASTIHVDWNGGGDYTTIGEAMSAAVTGDTVLVAAGTYSGVNNRNLNFGNEEFTVMSAGGRHSVTIDGGGVARGFRFIAGSGSSVLSGFTIQNGSDVTAGGINISGCTPTITDCDIIDCAATSSSIGGGGVVCRDGAAPTFTDVTISSCQATNGAGMYAYTGGTPTLTRVRFEGNVAGSSGGGFYSYSPEGTVNITDCIFLENEVTGMTSGGGGMMLWTCSAVITGTTFARNAGETGGCIRLAGGASPTIENSILSFSTAGPPIGRTGGSEVPTTTRSHVYGNEENDVLVGNSSDIIYENPLFCDLLSGDLTLCSNSFALPSNNIWTVQMGALGDGGCGECDSPVEQTTWGRVKSLYR